MVKIVTEERALLLTNISDEQKYKINENIEKLEKKLLDIKEAIKAISKIDGAFSEEALFILKTKGAKVALDFINSKESIFAEEQMIIKLADKHRVRANIYIANQKYDEATVSYEKVMKYYDSFDNTLEYALFLMKQNNIKKSIKLHERLNTKKLTKEQEGGVLNNLGLLYERDSKYSNAKHMYLKALQIRKSIVKAKGVKYNDAVSITLNNLATLYAKLNKFDDAEENYLKALEIRKKPYLQELSNNNSKKADILSRLAVVYMKKGKYKDAEKKYIEALKIKKSFSSNISIAVTLTNLGSLYKRMKLFENSENAYLQAIKIKRVLVRKNKIAYNLNLAATLNGLASLYSKQSTLMIKSEKTYFEALKIYREFEKISPNIYIHRIGGILSNLTRLYIRNKKIEKARETYFESEKIFRTLVKKNRSAYGMTLASILIVGVASLNQSYTNLDLAENILHNFQKTSQVKKLLLQIRKLKKKI